MQRLAMYSDQVIPENNKVDARLLELMSAGEGRIGYVPSGPEPDRRFFRERRTYYSRLDLDLSFFFDPYGSPVRDHLAALLDCDAIHLSGGQTRPFLQVLKSKNLIAPIADWARNGGVLIGTSAGAILMTPTVALDALFTGEDPATVPGGNALDLVPFEFFPHLNKNPDYLQQLLSYSAKTTRRIAACRDGEGVIVSGDVVESVGDVVWIQSGSIVEPHEMNG